MNETFKNVRIGNMYLTPTQDYKDQYIRPYELNASQSNIDTFRTLFENDQRYNHNGISVVNVSNHVPNLLTKTAVPIGGANIIHGWQTERLRFLLEVISDEPGGQEFVSYIQGYSEYYDPSLSGKIDPNMSWYINSVVNVRRAVVPQTGEVISRVANNYNILYNHFDRGSSIDYTNDLVTTRPKDITDGLDSVRQFAEFDNEVSIVDSRGDFNSQIKTTHRKHNLAVQHLTDTVNTLNVSKQIGELTHDKSDIYREAGASLNSNDILKTPFMSILFNINDYNVSTTFTMAQLETLEPNITQIATVLNRKKEMSTINTIMDSENTEDLQQANLETHIATIISDSVTSLLTENLLTTISFTLTNLTADGLPVIAVTDVQSKIQGIDVVMFTNRFLAKFEQIVYPTISESGLIGMTIYITGDLLGDTTIAIGVNGPPNLVYRLPTFCDSLYSPVINNSYGVQNLLEGYREIVHNVIDEKM